MIQFTVLSRSYCHLCDDMIAALEEFRGRFSSAFEFTIVDIDQQPALEREWGEKVPVLLCDKQEICHYFLDEGALKQALTHGANATR